MGISAGLDCVHERVKSQNLRFGSGPFRQSYLNARSYDNRHDNGDSKSVFGVLTLSVLYQNLTARTHSLNRMHYDKLDVGKFLGARLAELFPIGSIIVIVSPGRKRDPSLDQKSVTVERPYSDNDNRYNEVSKV